MLDKKILLSDEAPVFHESFANDLSVELVSASINEVKFLENVNAFSSILSDEKQLENAIRRYETCWLPMQAANPDVNRLPPLDVHYIWHCHVLRPKCYINDCLAIVGKLIDSKVFTQVELNDTERREQSIAEWNRHNPNEPYDINNESTYEPYTKKSNYDLLAAALRHHKFINKALSSDLYTNADYMKQALIRYRQYLFACKYYPDEVMQPAVDMDIVWHSHQLHPISYLIDCKELFGHLVNHNDTVYPGNEDRVEQLSKLRAFWKRVGMGDFIESRFKDFQDGCVTGAESGQCGGGFFDKNSEKAYITGAESGQCGGDFFDKNFKKECITGAVSGQCRGGFFDKNSKKICITGAESGQCGGGFFDKNSEKTCYTGAESGNCNFLVFKGAEKACYTGAESGECNFLDCSNCFGIKIDELLKEHGYQHVKAH